MKDSKCSIKHTPRVSKVKLGIKDMFSGRIVYMALPGYEVIKVVALDKCRMISVSHNRIRLTRPKVDKGNLTKVNKDVECEALGGALSTDWWYETYKDNFPMISLLGDHHTFTLTSDSLDSNNTDLKLFAKRKHAEMWSRTEPSDHLLGDPFNDNLEHAFTAIAGT